MTEAQSYNIIHPIQNPALSIIHMPPPILKVGVTFKKKCYLLACINYKLLSNYNYTAQAFKINHLFWIIKCGYCLEIY